MEQPIIVSLLDTDFYKFTMAQAAWKRHKDVPVTYAFKNRTAKVRLAEVVDIGELREQFDHVRSLRFVEDEIAFLGESSHVPIGLFSNEFLSFLEGVRLPEYRLSAEDGQFVIETDGPWPVAMFWETFILSIVNELYNRASVDRGNGAMNGLHAVDEGWKRLIAKADSLESQAPNAKIIEFGTRRRFSGSWQTQVASSLKTRLDDRLVGTSNVALARLLGIPPIGTMAHEMFMVYSGIYHGSDDEIRSSHNRVLRDWWKEYGARLSIALTDTYGSEFFFRDMTAEQAEDWRGLRQDSGDPFSFGERAIGFYEHYGVDPSSKLIVFSDGLDVDAIVRLHKYFEGRIKTSFGWGTDLTNDCGIKPLSLVVKAVKSCGHPTVKLSDNPAKATGPADEVARYQRVFDADPGTWKDCRV
jgi:nicotinate phosphoribosyltransferase